MAVERNGHFLFVEAKHEGEIILSGQRRLFEWLSRQPFSVMWVVRGPRDTPTTVQRVIDGKWMREQPTNCENFKRMVKEWFEMADRNNAGRKAG